MLNTSAAQAVPSLRFELPTQVPALRCWMSLQCALLCVWQCAVWSGMLSRPVSRGWRSMMVSQ